jgi:hypothetical protein
MRSEKHALLRSAALFLLIRCWRKWDSNVGTARHDLGFESGSSHLQLDSLATLNSARMQNDAERLLRYPGFESGSLQRRVNDEMFRRWRWRSTTGKGDRDARRSAL